MKSQKILPLNQRLDNLQILELEGFKAKSYQGAKPEYTTFLNPNFSNAELLLKYHKALKEAEKSLKEIQSNLNDKLVDIQSNLDTEFRSLINKLGE